MSVSLFSVCLGSVERAPLVMDLVDTMVQVERGISRLMTQLHLTSQLELRRTICSERKEWVDVSLVDGAQMSLFDRLDTALGTHLTLPEIEGSALNEQVQRAVHALHSLHRGRVWHSSEFLASLEPLSLTAAMRTVTCYWPQSGGQLSLRTSEGLTTLANVPNRVFSARSDQRFRLTFRPREVGRHSANVILDHESAGLIRSKNRSIRIAWSTDEELELARTLIACTLEEAWMTGTFSVVRNRYDHPKSLLLLGSASLERLYL